jgi:hypothetical protein
MQEWSQISIGGANGFFIVILTLAWWIAALEGDWKDADLCWAVDETFWALSEITSVSREGGQGLKKHVAEVTSEELRDQAGSAKRWVDLFS